MDRMVTSYEVRVRPPVIVDDQSLSVRRSLQWALAFLSTLAIHVAVFFLLNHEAAPMPVPTPDLTSAVMIELAPEVQTAASQTDQALGQTMQETEETEAPPPEAPKVETPPVEAAPVDAVAPLPPAPPVKPKPQETKAEEKPKKPAVKKHATQHAASAPRSDSLAQRTTASSAGADVSPAAKAEWSSALRARIESNKRYPSGADQYGTPSVRATINRSGAVLSATLVSSSGSAALDDEALATVRRSSPLPPPPDGVGGATTSFTFRINFQRR